MSEAIEIVLTAVIGKGVEMSADAAADAVRRIVKRWRAERLDPPRIEIDTETTPDAGPADDENS